MDHGSFVSFQYECIAFICHNSFRYIASGICQCCLICFFSNDLGIVRSVCVDLNSTADAVYFYSKGPLF